MTEWTKEKEKKVMWKYRFLLTVRVVRVVLLLLLIYGIYMVVLTIGYNASKIDDKHAFHINLGIDWTQSGLHGDYASHTTNDITPFLSQKFNIPLYRTVGKEEQVIGEWNATKRLLPFTSTRDISYLRPSDNKRFGFVLPEDPRTGKKIGASSYGDEIARETLEKVHEGTVADLAFSTSKYYEPKELLEKLEKYDVDILWMPVYAGEITEFEAGWSSTGDGQNMSVDTIGLTRAVKMDDDFRGYAMYMLDSQTIEENQKTMLENMKNLLEDETNYYIQHELGIWYLEERHEYLKENGFQVYGAVVTGPVKELLKLIEEPEFRSVQLGEFEYWNWTE
ncbi:anti-sigma factor C-terminal domain-containing protein [Fredinandcohnia sp. 179-A 10B2 NHS]|uniref:anti-sigma factor C-terminal domain-containing protein n=1 Tax=Fredinandcohnia sp. 179-A 10B2 NHS TaxID=3235176 RepID=UPI0039A1DC43